MLTMFNVTREQAGLYSLAVVNSQGGVWHSFTVSVSGEVELLLFATLDHLTISAPGEDKILACQMGHAVTLLSVTQPADHLFILIFYGT